MKRPGYNPMTREELLTRLKVSAKQRTECDRTIDDLLRTGDIARIKTDRLCLPSDADLKSGRILFRQSGAAILVPDKRAGAEDFPAILIRAEDTWVAMHKDRVLVRVSEPDRGQRSRRGSEKDQRTGRVIRILERARTTLTGSLQRTRLFYYVIPDDPRIIQDIYVPNPEKTDLNKRVEIGDKVVVTLHEWKQRHLNPEGEVVEVLGKTNEPGAELKAIFRKFDLDLEFPESVEKEVAKVPDTVQEKDLKGRLDLRDEFTFTIDPDDAKDFDDALSIERLENGAYRVGVHIADVASYVRPDSALDKEAKRRGNSTYLIGTVIPMLPHKLSNGLCSLVEDQDRLTKSVFLTISRDGKIRSEFANSVIRSSKRLTYRQALAFLTEDSIAKIRKTPLPPAHQTGTTGRSLTELSAGEMKRLQQDIRALWSVASKIRKARMDHGSLDLDMPEVKIFVDEKGYADRMETIEYDETHQLIEEFMLLANEAVARELTGNDIPSIYRVHPEPDPEKLDEYRETLATYNVEVGDLTNRKEAKKALALVRDHPQGHALRIQFLRSLKQASYEAKPKGHYGLNKRHYTHFTSPIRRYSDLVVHRVFEHYLVKFAGTRPLPGKRRRYTQGELENIAEHLSITEQNSTEAEREHTKLKLLEFFERELDKKEKTAFEAVITEVRNHGMFIELVQSQAFGLIHISTLRDDLYSLTADGTAIQGRRSRNRYEVGQKVKVFTDRVDRFKRQIDFRLAEPPQKRSGQKRSAQKRPAQKRPSQKPTAAASKKKPKRRK